MGSNEPVTCSVDYYLRSEAVVSRLIAGETLVVPVRGKVGDLASIYSFNETGTTIWEAIGVARDLEELARLIAEKYEVSKAQAEEDTERFLNEMCAAGLVTVVNA